MKLKEYETIIRDNLNTFIKVGNALRTIKKDKLWLEQKTPEGNSKFQNFENYCNVEWGFSVSKAYYLLDASSIVNDLDTKQLPKKAAHAKALSILSSKERDLAWTRVLQSNKPITAHLVQQKAREVYLEEKCEKWDKTRAETWQNASVSLGSNKAYEILRETKKSSQNGKLWHLVEEHGLKGNGIDPETISALRKLNSQAPDEINDIQRSGFLTIGEQSIPIHKASKRDVERLARWHFKEEKMLEREENEAVGLDTKKEHSILIAMAKETVPIEYENLFSVFYHKAHGVQIKIGRNYYPANKLNGHMPSFIDDLQYKILENIKLTNT